MSGHRSVIPSGQPTWGPPETYLSLPGGFSGGEPGVCVGRVRGEDGVPLSGDAVGVGVGVGAVAGAVGLEVAVGAVDAASGDGLTFPAG